MMNFLRKLLSGIQAVDFVPPVCGKIAGKFRNYFQLVPPQERTAHYRYLPLDYHPDFVLDIGAATGFTGYAALQAFDRIPVYCIEPIKENFIILEKSLAAFPERNRASAYNLAVSDSVGEMEINVTSSKYSNSLFDLPETYRKDNPDIQVTEKRKIQVVTLDAFNQVHKLEGQGLVIIDVEGAELNVLTGGEMFF